MDIARSGGWSVDWFAGIGCISSALLPHPSHCHNLADWKMGVRRSPVLQLIWLVPARDAISFVVWLAGFFSEKVVWRGLEYRLHQGKLSPIPSKTTVLPARREPLSSVVGYGVKSSP